ncbi:MAG: Unknown protein [uncultured Sulfurovum sp.]|uniref:Uncharacterized protein n=1 Tax=uncultured Sulfurovum sp. TaxID=269237 RepID=A0A6S6U402_9BACT|nr:MAG: Unknown protein [uncultured Sulfurovum sp.]
MIYCIIRKQIKTKNNMNLKIIEKSLLPLLLATIFIVAFHWQFTYIYPYLIENLAEAKLSTLYAHLFIYIFLVFTLFLFFMNLINLLFKSKVFIAVICIALFSFYGFSSEAIVDTLQYFINYPLSVNGIMFMVLFVVTTFIYGSYSLIIVFFNKLIPLSHSLVFLLISIVYSAWFIEVHCYPISSILTRF